MYKNKKQSKMGHKIATIFFFLSLLLPLIASSSLNQSLIGSHGISAVFAFGDSTLDPGNNDYIPTLLQSNHAPYGRNFPAGIASGRFTDGKLIMTDFLVSTLGLKYVLPAYLDPSVTDQSLLTGVSYASAGTGLDDLTATISNVIRMSTQLEYFEQSLGRIQRAVGVERGREIVGNALFAIGAGSNDLIWNFYGLPTRKLQFSVSGYHDFLLGNLESFIQRLYSMGAMKFSLSGLPPIGCLPFQRTASSFLPSPNMFQRVCVQEQNTDSQAYNAKLQALVFRMQASLPGTKIAYVDIFNPVMDMIINPSRYGFVETSRGCCGTGLMEMGSLCNNIVPTCADASKFLFWDAVHPTQAAYHILADIFDATVLPSLMG